MKKLINSDNIDGYSFIKGKWVKEDLLHKRFHRALQIVYFLCA